MIRTRIIRALAGIAVVAAVLGGSGCATVADTRTTIVVWSWEPSMGTVIENFEAENPDIHVEWLNTSGYENLNRAIQDGYDLPDVVQLEYYALQQYAVSDQLLDVSDRTDGYDDFYTPGTWASVQLDGTVYGLPMDSGPMAFFYNADVFEQAGVDATEIRTWDDYYEAAKKLKEIGVYIAADSGDASFFNAMVWLAGGSPFDTSEDGKSVTISLDTDEGVVEFVEFWQKMIDEDLINTKLSTWSDDWKEALGSGQVASVFAGAWMPSLLLSDVPGTSGLWRVTLMPTADGSETNAENGGSALSVLQSTRKPDAAWRFVEYVCHNSEGIATRVNGGAFPADNATLESDDFLNKTTVTDSRGIDVSYFGGQEYNKILAQAAQDVSTSYQYLPYEVYARNDFESTVGDAYRWANKVRKQLTKSNTDDTDDEDDEDDLSDLTGRVTLMDGIEEWQSDLILYGINQGFVVNGESS